MLKNNLLFLNMEHTASPSSTWAISSPVAGLSVLNIFPDDDFTNSLLINSYNRNKTK